MGGACHESIVRAGAAGAEKVMKMVLTGVNTYSISDVKIVLMAPFTGQVVPGAGWVPAFDLYPSKGKAGAALALPLHKNGNVVISSSPGIW